MTYGIVRKDIVSGVARQAAGFFQSQAYRQSRPILLTSFTNKMGAIGLGLLPILLVERNVSTAQGTLVLTSLKTVILFGTLAGGVLSDRFGARGLVLSAFMFSAAGLGLLPFQSSIALLLCLALLAQFGETLLEVALRLLLMRQVAYGAQKEAIGWLRMVNNGAQIFSFSLAALASRLGVMPLMLFDSATALAAFFVGRKILPRGELAPLSGEAPGEGASGPPASKAAFFGFALVVMGWSFLYELFMEGGAGRLEILHPGEGLRRFSLIMVLNTVLCTAFAVHASRFFQNALAAMTWGLVLTAAGLLIAVWGMASQLWVTSGMLVLTLGEVMLGAFASFTLMRLSSMGGNAGFYYSLGLALMKGGRVLGAALAFPLLIHAPDLRVLSAVVVAVLTLLLAVLYSQRREIARLTA